MLCAAFLGALACSSDTPPPGLTHGELVPGRVAQADLDGDGSVEQVEIDPGDDSLTISDGSVFYRSRDKWTVVQATLSDTDGDGVTEVVALLDSDKGRHIGVFAYHGEAYRERLVTQALDPAPLRLEIVTGVPAGGGAGREWGADGATRRSDLLVLIQPPAAEGGTPQRTLLRWNGFGYTRVDG